MTITVQPVTCNTIDEKCTTDTLTILHHPTIQLSKTWTKTPKGWSGKGHPNAKVYRRLEEVPLSSFDDLVAALRREEASPNSHPIRGDFNHGHAYRHRFPREYKKGQTFNAPKSHRWQHFDLDTLLCPARLEGDHAAQVQYAIDQLFIAFPDLKGSHVYYQWSSSAGVKKGKIKLHLWVFLAHHADEEEMKAWVSERNKAYGHGFGNRVAKTSRRTKGLVDDVLWRRVQIHYTTPPTFIGGNDPLAEQGVERSGVIWGDVGEADIREALAGVRERIEDRKRREADIKARVEELLEYNKRHRRVEEGGALEEQARRIWEEALDVQRACSAPGTRTPRLFVTSLIGASLCLSGYLDRNVLHRELEEVFVASYLENPSDAKRQVKNLWDGAFDKAKPRILGGPRRQGKPGVRRPEPPPLEDKDAPMWITAAHAAGLGDLDVAPDEADEAETNEAPLMEISSIDDVCEATEQAHAGIVQCTTHTDHNVTEGPNTPGRVEDVEAPKAPQNTSQLSIDALFARIEEDQRRLLNTPGQHAICSPPGSGKNYSLTKILQSDLSLLDDILILEPTVAKRRETTDDLRAAGLPVKHAVTRTKHNCDRMLDILRASEVHPEGAKRVCTSCEQHPESPDFCGSICTYLREVTDRGATVMTHAQGWGYLSNPEGAKPRVVVIDEDASGVEHGEVAIDIHGLVELRNAEDVEIDPEDFEKLRGLLHGSKPDEHNPKPGYIRGSDIELLMGGGRPFVPVPEYKAATKALKVALWHGIQHGVAGNKALTHTPSWRAIKALEHIEQYGWKGSYAYNGDLVMPWFMPMNFDGVETVLRLDATTTEGVFAANGGDGEYVDLDVETPENFTFLRVNESFGKGSTHAGMLSQRKLKVWKAAHQDGDGPHRLHITHKAWCMEGHPMFEHVSQLVGPVIWFGGDEARGSNRYKGLTEAVVDSWHVPKRAVDALAYRLQHLAKLNGADTADRNWEDEAHWALHPSEVIQTIERLRGIRATEERPVKVTLLDSRCFEDSAKRYEDSCEVQTSGEFLFLHTCESDSPEVLDEQTADALLEQWIESQEGAGIPALFYANPATLETLKNEDENIVADGVGQPNPKMPYIYLGGSRIWLTQTHFKAIREAKNRSLKPSSDRHTWEVSKVSTPRGVYALLHTKPYTPDDVRRCVQGAGTGWTTASINGQRLRLDDWAERFDAIASGLPVDASTWPKSLLGEWIAHQLGESVATLRRNLKATGRSWSSALALRSTAPPSPEPVQPPTPEPTSAPEEIAVEHTEPVVSEPEQATPEIVHTPSAAPVVDTPRPSHGPDGRPLRALVTGRAGLEVDGFWEVSHKYATTPPSEMRRQYARLKADLRRYEDPHLQGHVKAEMWSIALLVRLGEGDEVDEAVARADASV